MSSAQAAKSPALIADAALLRVSKAQKRALEMFVEGVYLASTAPGGLEELRHRVCADRLRLAADFLVSANRLYRMRPACYRDAISRYYYGMYHSARAVVYYAHGGDDHESHNALPGQIPKDFPDAARWTNALKDARAYRNAADYDPYPEEKSYWRGVAANLATEAPALLRLAKQYLGAKGCGYI